VKQLRLNLRSPTDNDVSASERVKAAAKRKKAATETLDEAWQRIFAMKNTPADIERLREVKRAMDAGVIGRHPQDAPKRFSKAEALRLWRELEERKKSDRIRQLIENTPKNYVLVDNAATLSELREMIETSDLIAIDCETFGENDGDQFDPWIGEMAGFSVSNRERHYYVPLNHVEKTELTPAEIFAELKQPLESTPNVMHNASFDAKFFYVKYGVDLITNLVADTQIMSMALDENRSHRLKDLAKDWLRIEDSYPFDKLFASPHRFNEVPLKAALVYAAGDTEKTLLLYDWMLKHFDRRDDLRRLKRLVFEIEMPVARQFIRSDLRGIGFDKEAAAKLDIKFAEEEERLIKEITELLGEEINIGSPAQLSKKLYKDLKLPDLENGSTNSKVLKKITSAHPVVPKILEFRQVNQLRKAFTKTLPDKVKADGKIHQSHNTWGAVTGRFTCQDPNTQQMPSNRPEVRKLFVTEPGRIFISIDYSQIELRVLAHLANDPVLIDAFKTGKDIHSTTASQITGIPYEQIEANKDVEGSPEQKARKNAKPVNFGIAYGITSKGLANQLNITEAEAQNIIDSYFKGYPAIKEYMETQKRLARTRGYVTDIFGRKRRLRDQYKKGYGYGADRQAGNFPIQASAGSIMKKAIVDLQPILPEMDVNILLQIHDELLFDAPETITREEIELIRSTMENAVNLVVPIRCDVEIYPKRWMESVSLDEWFEKQKEESA
jgi:DNA polymerase I